MSSSNFEQSQRDYYLREINRALPVSSRAADLSTIQAALGVVDPAMPEDTRPLTDAAQFMSTFGRQTDAMTRDAECRILPMPGDAMRADAGARTGCGWWFVPDPAAHSVGAYGTRRGPMNPSLDRQYGSGQWIWEPREAQRREELKQAARVGDCATMSMSPIADRLGWCADTNMAVIVNADGTPRYPTAPGGDCPSTPTATCPTQPAAGGAGTGGGGAGGSGAASGLCAPGAGGSLSPACIQSLIFAARCSQNGALYRALNSGYAGNDPTFQTLNFYLSQAGMGAPAGIVGPAAITPDQVTSYATTLQSVAITDTTRVGRAAMALCNDASIDPCDLINSTDSGPFPPTCITQTALKMGYQPDGGIMPSVIGMDYWNTQVGGTWQNVLDNLTWWKRTADTPPTPGQQNNQLGGVWNTYGVSMKVPRTGCNYTGMYIYRYYYNTADPRSFYNGTNGPHTHFLGRYIVRQNDMFFNNTASSAQIMPAGSTNVEAQRFIANFRPNAGGSYAFQITYDDNVRFTLYDGNNAIILSTDWQTNPSTTITTGTVNLVAGQVYLMVIDMTNAVDIWSLNVQAFINGTGPTPIDGTQLFLPVNSRLPMFELAFNKMPAGSGTRDTTLVPVSDTNNVLQNLAFYNNAYIGTLAGKTCMLVNSGGIFNFNRFSQGIRARAFKSMTMMINVTSFQNSSDGKTAPSLISFYNLGDVDPAQGILRAGSPPISWDYGNRTQDLSIFMFGGNAGLTYKDARDPTILPQYYYNTVPLSLGQWHHIAIVWDDDFQGYAFFMDGKLAGQLRATGPGVSQMFEQMRIGSDATGDGARWQGGIAWFRAFDHRLTTDDIQLDMNDNWASLP